MEPVSYTHLDVYKRQVVFMGIIAIALILAHFRQSLLAGYFICGVILANCGILEMCIRDRYKALM